MLRYASILLLLFLCLIAQPQPHERSNPDVLKRFHDDALNITYFYPSRFVPVPSPPSTAFTTDTPQCVRTTLFANSITPIDTSSFALSTVDNTCPDFLRRGTQLVPFIREEILHQLSLQFAAGAHIQARPTCRGSTTCFDSRFSVAAFSVGHACGLCIEYFVNNTPKKRLFPTIVAGHIDVISRQDEW
jgi:hypothetical protein